MGSGDPVGPLVIVTVSPIEFTCAGHEPLAECPDPSLTVTASVHVCWAPVALDGAFQAGAAVAAFGTNVPAPRPPVQLEVHA